MIGRDELAAWLRLTLAPGIGGDTQRKLLTAFGPPEVINCTGRSALRAVIGDKADALIDFDPGAEVDRAQAWLAAPGNHLLTLADPRYPRCLLDIPDPPSVLYVRGRLELLEAQGIAVVGSRNATPQGLANAEQFSRALSQAGHCIISGLALGIDAAAHRGALAGPGSTLAVIGTGIDRIYPARNEAITRQIAAEGVIVSEFPLGTPPLAGNFPRRNRLISAFSRGVLVVEAALESGSLITARLAAEQGRDVFAIPGSIHSPVARGCHRLIKQGAKLVETAQDILEELGSLPLSAPDNATEPMPEDGLLALLGHDPTPLDTLVARSGLPAETLLGELLTLELAGRIAALPGSRYQRLD